MYRARPADGVAWVTGASTGIGRATALELARRGWTIAATARRVAELESLAAEAAALGARVRVHAADVTSRETMAIAVRDIERDTGPIALAMLNAGSFFPEVSDDIVGENFRATVRLNVDGVINSLEPLLPLMKARGRGQIAVMASIAGYGGLPTAASYCLGKTGLVAMSESLKFALDPLGVTMQVICPGYVKTPLTDRQRQAKPCMISAEAAATRICDGFERDGFEIAFPRRLAWVVKAFRHLPYFVYFPLLAAGSRRYG